MNKNCQLFYKRLRTLFPSIGFAEGKFLRDIKMQLRDYSIENPNAEYEDVYRDAMAEAGLPLEKQPSSKAAE